MALIRLREELARALEKQGTPVDSALDTPDDTPHHLRPRLFDDNGPSHETLKTSGFGLRGLLFEARCTTNDAGTPPRRDRPYSAPYQPDSSSTTPFPTPRLLPERPIRTPSMQCRRSEDQAQTLTKPGTSAVCEDASTASHFLFAGSCLKPYVEGSQFLVIRS
ncbi:unnamed protein product, partial [Polarella glacialis]